MTVSITILIREPLRAWQVGDVTAALRDFGDDVSDSRKGKHWEFFVRVEPDTPPLQFCLSHDSTNDQEFCLEDFADEILEQNLDIADFPEAFSISAGFHGEHVQRVCREVAARLASLFHGVVLRVSD